MEAATRKRLWQKAKNIYYSLRSLLCFFISVENDDAVIPGTSGSGHSEKVPSLLQLNAKPEVPGDSHFPFEELPEVCQLHVFSYLSVVERGRASTVCRHWNDLLRSAILWTDVDLTVFPLCCRCPCLGSGEQCTSLSCYEAYKERIQASFKLCIGHMSGRLVVDLK